MRRLVRVLGIIAALLLVLALVLRLTVGGGRVMEDRTGPPELPGTVLEKVVDLDYPPGNIAVTSTGRVFFTYHPDGDPPDMIAEVVDGRAVPYRPKTWPPLETPLALRTDRDDRLWVLDHARFGRGEPRIVAFDTKYESLVHQYKFPREVAPFLSMLNDLAIDKRGERVYISEASPIRQTPSLIFYEPLKRQSRRLLEGHPSVLPEDYLLNVEGRTMRVFGLVTMKIGADSIALDQRSDWLYFGPVNGGRLYRVPSLEIAEWAFPPDQFPRMVEDYGPKPNSDGILVDMADNVFLTDPEHSAILVLGPDRKLRTLVKDPKLRWPDGLAWGPDGWLYVTCSALQHVLFRSAAHMRANAPYQIYRFKPGLSEPVKLGHPVVGTPGRSE